MAEKKRKTRKLPEPTQEIKILVNIDVFTFGDWETMDKWARGKSSLTDLIEMLNRIVIGGVKDLPVRAALPRIMDAISAAMNATGNPGTAPKNSDGGSTDTSG